MIREWKEERRAIWLLVQEGLWIGVTFAVLSILVLFVVSSLIPEQVTTSRWAYALYMLPMVCAWDALERMFGLRGRVVRTLPVSREAVGTATWISIAFRNTLLLTVSALILMPVLAMLMSVSPLPALISAFLFILVVLLLDSTVACQITLIHETIEESARKSSGLAREHCKGRGGAGCLVPFIVTGGVIFLPFLAAGVVVFFLPPPLHWKAIDACWGILLPMGPALAWVSFKGRRWLTRHSWVQVDERRIPRKRKAGYRPPEKWRGATLGSSSVHAFFAGCAWGVGLLALAAVDQYFLQRLHLLIGGERPASVHASGFYLALLALLLAFQVSGSFFARSLRPCRTLPLSAGQLVLREAAIIASRCLGMALPVLIIPQSSLGLSALVLIPVSWALFGLVLILAALKMTASKWTHWFVTVLLAWPGARVVASTLSHPSPGQFWLHWTVAGTALVACGLWALHYTITRSSRAYKVREQDYKDMLGLWNR